MLCSNNYVVTFHIVSWNSYQTCVGHSFNLFSPSLNFSMFLSHCLLQIFSNLSLNSMIHSSVLNNLPLFYCDISIDLLLSDLLVIWWWNVSLKCFHICFVRYSQIWNEFLSLLLRCEFLYLVVVSNLDSNIQRLEFRFPNSFSFFFFFSPPRI